MIGNTITELIEIFKRFPGIGPRQAKRFVYFLLQQDKTSLDKFLRLVKDLSFNISQCSACQRFFQSHNGTSNTLCTICRDEARYTGQLLLVEKDADLDSLEKAGSHQGVYFILGGLVPILAKEPEKKIRLVLLQKRITELVKQKKLTEVIIALAATVEADHTAEFLKLNLNSLAEKTPFKISVLGRGLSGGLEIEYSDAETLKSALSNRHLL
ncbi:hypothetical protein BK005_01710 [bacterium CG10_37_50]|nr:MAG: hypothetical protein BK005_01710 [bacterium CG10_37_50]